MCFATLAPKLELNKPNLLLAAVRFAVQTVLLELLVKRVAIDAQAASGFDLYAFAFVQDLGNRFTLYRVDDAAVDVGRIGTSFLNAQVHQLLGQRIKV